MDQISVITIIFMSCVSIFVVVVKFENSTFCPSFFVCVDNEDAKLPDHEAAHCLLSLSQRSPGEEATEPKSLVPRQPTTYPYVQSDLTTAPKTQTNTPEFNPNQPPQHDGFIKSDAVISKISLSPSNDASVATGSKTPTDTTKLKRVIVNSDVIDLSKPRSVSSSSEGKDTDSKPSTPSTPTSYGTTAELLNTLMKLSDKVPATPQPSLDFNMTPASSNGQQPNTTNNMHYQNYLTERALQKSKMKLSQVHTLNAFDDKPGHKFFKESGSAFFPMLSKKLDHIEISLKPRSVIMANLDKARKDSKVPESQLKIDTNPPEKLSNTTTIVDQSIARDEPEERVTPETSARSPTASETVGDKNAAVKVELHIAKPSSIETCDISKSINDQSGMDTLAEIAANSVKLDATESAEAAAAAQSRDASSSANVAPFTASAQQPSPKPSAAAAAAAVSSESVSRKDISAKNIASEFLKLANEQHHTIDDSSASSDSDAMTESINKHRRSSVMSLGSGPEMLISARTVIVGEDGFKSKSANANDLPVVAMPRGSASNNASRKSVAFIQDDGGPVRCKLCSSTFPKHHQLLLHMHIHVMAPEAKYRCDSCCLSFQTQNRLTKHLRSEAHSSKANMVGSLGTSKSKNPRPYECSDCDRAFRIHGHLAKHLRSKTHVQKLECLQKLPFGTYAMIEEHKVNLADIDTTDCDNSLASLKALAERLKMEENFPHSSQKRKLTVEGYESHSSSGGGGSGSGSDKDQPQSTSDTNTDKNTGLLIKKRKLNDACKETLTISEGDEN